MLCVCKDKIRKYQSLGISINPKHWNFKANQVKEDCPDYARIQLIIDAEIGKIKRKALENRLDGKEFTATTLLETEEKQPPKTVGELYIQYIENLKLENRVREYLGEAQMDEGRLLTEVAIFADKVNVNEETVRLRSHVEQFTSMLEEGGSVGRKIDFLIQEMNREINTIGSKSQDLDVARIVIDVKAEIEKLREQIQNVE